MYPLNKIQLVNLEFLYLFLTFLSISFLIYKKRVHSFVHKYLLNAPYVPGIGLGFGDTAVNETDAVPVFMVLMLQGRSFLLSHRIAPNPGCYSN